MTFDIDADGIVHVSAKDLGTGKEQTITVTGGAPLSQETIARMIKDAEAHAEEDRKRRDGAEVRNNADLLAYQTEKLLKEQADRILPRERTKAEAALKHLRDALDGDVEALRQKHEALIAARSEIARYLHP